MKQTSSEVYNLLKALGFLTMGLGSALEVFDSTKKQASGGIADLKKAEGQFLTESNAQTKKMKKKKENNIIRHIQ